MSVKTMVFLIKLRSKTSHIWRKTLTFLFLPLVNTLEKWENQRHERFKANLTKEKAVKWIVKDIVKYILKKTHREIKIMVADYFDAEEFSACSLRYNSRIFSSKKAKRAYYLLEMNTDLQLKIIEELSKIKGVTITEYKENFTGAWYQPRGYIATFKIAVG